jgi:hypothetical protein
MSLRRLAWPFALLLAAAGAACNQNSEYLAVAGGGFIFNYRIAEASYGIALKPMRDIPGDAVITATFDDPAGAEPIVLSKEGPFNPTRIAFQTPALEGVVAHHPYNVIVVLADAEGAELQRIERAFESDVDQSVLPELPLVIGPTYQPNIDGSETAYPPSLNEPVPAVRPPPSPSP